MKLPKAIKAKWLKALRSGKYKQTKQTLYNPKTKGFCCLGVLQHVTHGNCEGPSRDDVDSGYAYGGLPSDGYWKAIGATGADWGHGSIYHASSTLSKKNDSGSSFKTIANWIEKNVEGY